MDDWTHVNESLPEEEDIYLVAWDCEQPSGSFIKVVGEASFVSFVNNPYAQQQWIRPFYGEEKGDVDPAILDEMFPITHWRPFPAPPSDKEGQNDG